MIHNLLYETRVTSVIKLLKADVKVRSCSMGHDKHEQRQYCYLENYCRVEYAIPTLKDIYIIALYLMFLYNFHKLLLSTSRVLYLQKQSLVGTLQKQLLLILTNIFATF